MENWQSIIPNLDRVGNKYYFDPKPIDLLPLYPIQQEVKSVVDFDYQLLEEMNKKAESLRQKIKTIRKQFVEKLESVHYHLIEKNSQNIP